MTSAAISRQPATTAASTAAVLALAASTTLAATAPAAAATGPYAYQRQWSVTSTVWDPQAVAVAKDGTVHVAVRTGSLSGPTSIRRYTPNGTHKGTWRVGAGEVTDMAFDPSGNLHLTVIHAPYGEVQVRRPSTGTLVRRYARTTPGITNNMPNDLAIDDRGAVTVVYGQAHRLVRYHGSSGRYIRTIGRPGTARGRLDRPRSVAVGRDRSLLVVDAGNDRIQQFTPSGAAVRAFGRSGSTAGRFVMPRQVEVGTNGNVYVLDATRRVQEFSSTGKYRRTVSGSSRLNVNTDLAFSRSGRLYVTGYLASLKRGVALFQRR